MQLGTPNPRQQERFHIRNIDTFLYKPWNSSYTWILWYYKPWNSSYTCILWYYKPWNSSYTCMETMEFFLHLHLVVLQTILHLLRLISITASGTGGTSNKTGIKTSPGSSYPRVIGSQYFGNCK